MNDTPPSPKETVLPIARILESPPRTERWILTVTVTGFLLLAGLLVYGSMQRNLVITIRFRDGHGLRTGDPIRHRGIDVGRAMSVKLDPSLSRVIVKCELYPGAEHLARTGSKFWIVRPTISLSGVEGLDTIVGGRYLSVLPGPESADRVTQFDGLSDSPGNAEILDGGLEITLEAPERFGLARGTPIYFRGMRVGEVVSVGLSSDSLTVEARAVIGPDYRSLVRDNSVFWNDSGLNVHLGIRGLNMDVGTLESLAAGGVAFATRNPPGDLVRQGHRFSMAAKEIEDWREWKPKLVVGTASNPDHPIPPVMLRAEILGVQRGLVRRRDTRIGVWLLPLDDGRLVGPASVLKLPEANDQEEPPVVLALPDAELVMKDQDFEQFDGVVALGPVGAMASDVRRWPLKQLRVPNGPEDCLIVTDPENVPVPLSRQRFSVVNGHWTIDPLANIREDLRGAAVVSRMDGCVIGLIDLARSLPMVLPVQAEWIRTE